MKDGRYLMRLDLSGYSGRGLLEVQDKVAFGQDDGYGLTGRIDGMHPRCMAALAIELLPKTNPNSRVPNRFAVSMNGTCDDASFEIIGTGPLGLIVELRGSWVGPIE